MAGVVNKGNLTQGTDSANDAVLSLLREIADNIGGGGGGGGGGDASAANQATQIANEATQITAANLTNTKLSAGATTIAKAEDVASADADVGIPALAVRKAAPANTSGTDGDYEFLQISAGRLWTSAVIDTALPAGANAIGKLAANDGVDIGDVTINNAAGASAVNIQDGGNSITVDGTVAVTNTLLASGATGGFKVEDVASADADIGSPAMAVRKATPANTSGTDGDYEFLQMSAGRLWVDASGVTLTVGSHAVTNAGTFAVQEATLDTAIHAEDAASADAHTGFASLAVRKATPANTSGTDGDYEFLQMSAGRLWASSDITLGGTAIDGNSGVKSAGTLRVVFATDQPQLTNKLLVTPDANSAINLAQIAGTAASVNSGNKDAGTLRVILATDQPNLTSALNVSTTLAAGTATLGATFGFQVECPTDITRPGDTAVYAANDAWANSTSAPTAGGFTWANAARISGGGGVITDVIIANSVALPGTILQGELWVFNQAVTAVNDNAAFTISDAEIKTCVAVIPFVLAKNGGANSLVHLQNLGIGFICSGSADLRYLVKVINAYTPSNAEVLSARAKIIQNN